ncbi:MAG: sigma-54-dependent transcriptional regulator [Halothiobacillaceae bacterium]
MSDVETTALIVDDEEDIRTLVEMTLAGEGVRCLGADSLAAAREVLARRTVDFCLCDLRLPDGDGLDLLDWIRERHPGLPVAMITAHGHLDAAVRALKSGAFDFVSKPLDLKTLRQLARDALRAGAGRPGAARRVRARAAPQLIGDSHPMEQLREQIRRVARSQAPVFVRGESGTGKELVARQIHAHSARGDGPFVPVNCGAIPAQLIESELFGHRRGAFTGASSDSPGLFRAACGGTLFLDEIAELPLNIQVKLLRAIQERRVRPVGSSEEVPVDVRIVSASHQDLGEAVETGRFRHDLYYRINVIELVVPPLRERLEDLPALAEHVLARLAEREGRTRCELTPEALNRLATHAFPGNVRELENLLERAVALSESVPIEPEALGLPPAPRTGPATRTSIASAPATCPDLAKEELGELARRVGLSERQLACRLEAIGD